MLKPKEAWWTRHTLLCMSGTPVRVRGGWWWVPGVMGWWPRYGPQWYPVTHLRVPSGSHYTVKINRKRVGVLSKSSKLRILIKNTEFSQKDTFWVIERTNSSRVDMSDLIVTRFGNDDTFLTHLRQKCSTGHRTRVFNMEKSSKSVTLVVSLINH